MPTVYNFKEKGWQVGNTVKTLDIDPKKSIDQRLIRCLKLDEIHNMLL